MRIFPVFIVAFIFVLTLLGPAPTGASNKGESPAASETSGETAEAPEASKPAPEPSETAESKPSESSPPVATPEPSELETEEAEPSPPGVEDAARPELPSLNEEAALKTVREDEPAAEQPSDRKGPSPATLAMLKALETRHASIVTVRGSFDQLKVSEIFLEEIKSKGTFRFKKPDLFRCDYEPPDEMTNLIREDAIYIYVPELEQCEVYRFASDQERDQQLHSMVLGFGFRTAELIKAYTIRSSEEPGALRDALTGAGQSWEKVTLFEMTPRPEVADTSPFTQLKLWIDKEDLLPEKVWFEDYNGDQTTLDIRSIELNTAIDPQLFAPSFPAGTEFIDKSES